MNIVYDKSYLHKTINQCIYCQLGARKWNNEAFIPILIDISIRVVIHNHRTQLKSRTTQSPRKIQNGHVSYVQSGMAGPPTCFEFLTVDVRILSLKSFMPLTIDSPIAKNLQQLRAPLISPRWSQGERHSQVCDIWDL